MPQVLTTSADIRCPHGGIGKSVPTNPKWMINDGHVLLDGDTGTLSCLFEVPCRGYQLRSLGLNASVIDGTKVMLVTDFTQSFTGFPLTITEIHQVFDEGTPVPVPVGGPVPPTPPELQESDPPVVAVAPAELGFSLSSGTPPELSMIFTLQSQFPRQWILSLLHLPTFQQRDITNGDPPRITVTPARGAWTSPSLIVTVTLIGTFMATLALGPHHFVLAAVNHRGQSNYAEAILTVGA